MEYRARFHKNGRRKLRRRRRVRQLAKAFHGATPRRIDPVEKRGRSGTSRRIRINSGHGVRGAPRPGRVMARSAPGAVAPPRGSSVDPSRFPCCMCGARSAATRRWRLPISRWHRVGSGRRAGPRVAPGAAQRSYSSTTPMGSRSTTRCSRSSYTMKERDKRHRTVGVVLIALGLAVLADQGDGSTRAERAPGTRVLFTRLRLERRRCASAGGEGRDVRLCSGPAAEAWPSSQGCA